MDPNVSFFMLLGGVTFSYLEFLRPGWVWPGVAGGVVAMVGLARLAQLGLDPLAAASLALGAALLLAEAYLWHRRAFLLYGTILSVSAGLMTWGGSHLAAGMEERLVVLAVLPFVILTTILLTIALRARRNKLPSAAPMR